MHRRDWLKCTSAAGLALLTSRWSTTARAAEALSAQFPGLAERVLAKATELGASFADLHLMQTDSESLYVREEMVQGVNAGSSLGGSVRVLVDGAWGFAASGEITESRLLALVESAVAIAREIADNTAPVSVALSRQMMWRMLGADHPMEAHRVDSRGIQARGRSADASEGVTSFLEKRAAVFPDKVSDGLPAIFPDWEDPQFS